MTKTSFRHLVVNMVDTYGCKSYLDNDDDVDEDNLWFECPECYDVVAYDDWENDKELNDGFCPICGSPLF